MLDVRRKVVRRWVAVVAVTTLLTVPTTATAAPAGPSQEDPTEGEGEEATDRALIDVDESLAQAEPAVVAEALGEINANVAAQLEGLRTARGNVDTAMAALSEADAAIQNSELGIEDLTARSDDVVIQAFINPPAEDAWAIFQSDSIADATVRHGILDLRTDESADVLGQLAEAREALEVQRADQETRRQEAEQARADAVAALEDLEAAVDQQTQFVLQVQESLASPDGAPIDPALQARRDALQGRLDAVAEARRAAEEEARIERERREAEERARAMGTFICPVEGGGTFSDTWGAARSGGRSHQGTDMLAPTGTPTPAPASGEVEHRGTSLGGMSWYVYGDDGHTYYGTHLSAYERVGAGHVNAGDIIGYVGDTGNAAGTPHLHFEYHPNGGSAINPYPRLVEACR